MLQMKFDLRLGRVRPYLFDAYTPSEMPFGVSYPGVDWVKPSHFKAVLLTTRASAAFTSGKSHK